MSEEATLRIIFLREVFPLFWNLRIFSRLRWRFSFFAFTRHASREVVEVLTTPKVGAGAKAYEWQEWSLGEWRFGYKSCTQWGLTKDVQKKEMVQVDQFLLNVHAVGNVKSASGVVNCLSFVSHSFTANKICDAHWVQLESEWNGVLHHTCTAWGRPSPSL
jgi:hypothetical protein